MREQQSGRDMVELFQIVEQRRNFGRVLALLVVKKHVAAAMSITAEDLIRSFPRNHDLVTGLAYGTAEKILGSAMCVYAEGLRLQDRLGEVVCKIVLPD